MLRNSFFTILILIFWSQAFPALASVRCSKLANPKNYLDDLSLKKATIFQVYTNLEDAYEGVKAGYLIDLKKSHQTIRDNSDFLLFAASIYPTQYQFRAWASNCHDIAYKDPLLLELASNRLKDNSNFIKSIKDSRYAKIFLVKNRRNNKGFR